MKLSEKRFLEQLVNLLLPYAGANQMKSRDTNCNSSRSIRVTTNANTGERENAPCFLLQAQDSKRENAEEQTISDTFQTYVYLLNACESKTIH